MPIYEYRHLGKVIQACTKDFEVVQTMDDEPLEKCPRCGQPVQKLVSAFRAGKNKLSASNLRDKGFKRYVRRDKGVYEQDT